MKDARAEKLLQMAGKLTAERAPWDALWQELADVVHPRRGLINTISNTPDRSKLAELFDGTAMRSNQTLANGQSARVTPMGARWFVLRPPATLAEKPAAVAWYHRCSEILAGQFAASNFYGIAQQHYLDRGAFGIAATEVTSGKGGQGLHFRSFPVGTYSVAENSLGEIDTIVREYSWTPRQIIEAFPDGVPEAVTKRAADPDTANTKEKLVHFVMPRQDRDPRKDDSKNKPIASFHILRNESVILHESGFDEMPVPVSRWAQWGESPYGWAPSYAALPEATQANVLEQMMDVATETALFPRILYGSNMKGDIDFRAMGLTCYDSTMGDPPREWMTQGRIDLAEARAERKRKAIEDSYFVPLFNAVSQLRSDATAEQVRAILGESRELFHPIFSQLCREFLIPILRRSFALLLRQGAFPPPPPDVVQRDDLGNYIADPGVEFVSAMALALEQSHLANLNDILQTVMPMAASDPSILDPFDWDQIIPYLMRTKGQPESFIRPPEAINSIREGRAQAQQAQQAQAAAATVKDLGGIDAVQNAAGALPAQN
jgi:hypothetical protein